MPLFQETIFFLLVSHINVSVLDELVSMPILWALEPFWLSFFTLADTFFYLLVYSNFLKFIFSIGFVKTISKPIPSAFVLIVFCFYSKIALRMCTNWAYFRCFLANTYMSTITTLPNSFLIFTKHNFLFNIIKKF